MSWVGYLDLGQDLVGWVGNNLKFLGFMDILPIYIYKVSFFSSYDKWQRGLTTHVPHNFFLYILDSFSFRLS